MSIFEYDKELEEKKLRKAELRRDMRLALQKAKNRGMKLVSQKVLT